MNHSTETSRIQLSLFNDLEVLTERFEVCLSSLYFDMALWVGPHLSTLKIQKRQTSSLSVYNRIDCQDYIIPRIYFLLVLNVDLWKKILFPIGWLYMKSLSKGGQPSLDFMLDQTAQRLIIFLALIACH